MAGRRFEEFEVGQVLGVGTVGTIYEAYDKTNETPVALKCLLPAVSSDPVIQARFARENANPGEAVSSEYRGVLRRR